MGHRQLARPLGEIGSAACRRVSGIQGALQGAKLVSEKMTTAALSCGFIPRTKSEAARLIALSLPAILVDASRSKGE